jgi:hypothetical protein
MMGYAAWFIRWHNAATTTLQQGRMGTERRSNSNDKAHKVGGGAMALASVCKEMVVQTAR